MTDTTQSQPKKLLIKIKPRQPMLALPVEKYSWLAEGVYQGPPGTPEWLLPNNPKFIDWINDKFYEYRLDVETPNQSGKKDSKDLFLYQKFIQNYIAPSTPYRGILAFHKLGSGKTRTAIATAEPFRTAGFKVIVLLPASLTNNFIDEVKSWGNYDLSYPPNWSQMSPDEQKTCDQALTKKIKEVYNFISYNANNAVKQINNIKFANSIVIIDEVHNLLNMMTSSQSKQGQAIYKALMNATNCRFIALSGTPLLNFSFELGLLFNILRGYMTEARIPLFPEDELEFEQYFVDYATEKAKNIELFKRRITGLVSYYCGIQEELYPELILHEPEQVPMSSFQFSQYWQVRQEELATASKNPVCGDCKQNNFSGVKASKSRLQKSKKFLVSNTFRPNSRQYCNFTFPDGINRPKSLSKTTKEVLAKSKLDKDPEKWTQAQKMELYALFSKGSEESESETELEVDWEAYEDFVLSWSVTEIKKDCLQLLVETIEGRGFLNQFTEIVSREEETLIMSPESQEMSIKRALQELTLCQDVALNSESLPTYSPKMAKMFWNMTNGQGSEGKKFVYSNFRTLEGVEIFSRVLQVNGYELFNPGNPEHHTTPKLRYAIISGTETPELRRAILKAFNQNNNMYGEYLMTILGTSSAAEGISLKHVRQIHIMEPWWNEVRVTQVIGRGRRIGSHLELPESERNVHVFQYLSVLSDMQKVALKKEPKEHESTDEHVYNKAQSKARINRQFIHILMEAAVDSTLNSAHNQNLKFNIKPMTVSKHLKYMYVPQIHAEELLRYRDESQSQRNSEPLATETAPADIHVKFAELNLNIKGLLDASGQPLYVVFLDEANKYKKVLVCKTDDPKKLTYPAYVLYDKVSAHNSHKFVERAFLVDKLGLLSKDKVTIC